MAIPTGIILSASTVSLLLQEAEETIRQGTERGVILISQKEGSTLRVVRAISHVELERHKLVWVKIHDEPSFDNTYWVSTYFDRQGIRERYASETSAGNVLLFAHSHHPNFLEPSTADRSTSASDGGAVCFSVREGKLVAIGLCGEKDIPVSW